MRLLVLLLMAAPVLAQNASWDHMLKTYVNASALVDYPRWKQQDPGSLDAYLAGLAKPAPANASKAALINAYNALVVRWVIENYPVESIWQTPHPFTQARHVVNGEKVSLDGIEGRLRQLGDPRIHAALVCAARSCPPLRREAYTDDRLDQQLDDNLRTWLANPSLNQFDAATHTARVSEIFKWYQGDFVASAGSVEKFLEKYAPRQFTIQKVEYITYRWGLNDAAGHGAGYSTLRFYWDHERNK